jgi:hypothetical protein
MLEIAGGWRSICATPPSRSSAFVQAGVFFTAELSGADETLRRRQRLGPSDPGSGTEQDLDRVRSSLHSDGHGEPVHACNHPGANHDQRFDCEGIDVRRRLS